MSNTEFSEWQLDLDEGSALHTSGFSVRIEGDPRDPSAVTPGSSGANVSVVDQARLLREGMAALAAAAGPLQARTTTTRVKSQAQRTAEARAKLFAEAAKPERPKLSLKKNP